MSTWWYVGAFLTVILAAIILELAIDWWMTR